ncbi:MAG: TatD family hydrolase [Actinomycetota bacterium]
MARRPPDPGRGAGRACGAALLHRWGGRGPGGRFTRVLLLVRRERTFPNSEALREAARAVPGDLLLVETDSPFLAPQPLRGRDNAPANVGIVVDALAAARSERPERVGWATLANARRAFSLPG